MQTEITNNMLDLFVGLGWLGIVFGVPCFAVCLWQAAAARLRERIVSTDPRTIEFDFRVDR